ncbi:fimbrial assembly protein [Paraburkholderia aromaticivorans]|uniref:Fimbrial assembly protein n=1 Tax=Paraburkholderia aromaticivorans TaxID=2026199 RepID=A0A248VFW2_9BURK|nr:fimbrial assembly protein [Paraburkholderia aromaticivorans]ASV97926.1 fimbrial assembly protein [Paraburkholderia aromaticivorans]
MTGGVLQARVSSSGTPLRGARFTRWRLGGFNLLPYRQRDARLARRRRLLEWIAAVLAGCAAVFVLAGWQTVERGRLDAQRVSIERSLAQLSAPLAEHAALLRARDEQRQNAARASSLSGPLTHLRDLLDALSFEPGDGVVLQQLRHREDETELLASSRGHLASAGWLKRLSAIHGVKGAEVSELHSSASRGGAAVQASVTGPIEFGARLRWNEPAQKAARVAAPVAQRAVKSEQSGGAK